MRKQKLALEAKLKDELIAVKLPALSVQIEQIKSRGPTSIGEIVLLTGANRSTVKVHLKNLVSQGNLAVNGVGRGLRYHIR